MAGDLGAVVEHDASGIRVRAIDDDLHFGGPARSKVAFEALVDAQDGLNFTPIEQRRDLVLVLNPLRNIEIAGFNEARDELAAGDAVSGGCVAGDRQPRRQDHRHDAAARQPAHRGALVIRVYIVDDEPLAVKRLRRMLEVTGRIDVAGEATDPEEALGFLRRTPADVLFLDIQMPEMNGFEVLKSLNTELMPHVIFVTAYDRYAIQAFEVHALDYLLKPFDKKRFHQALKRGKAQVLQDQERSSNRELVALLKEMKVQSHYLDRLIIKSKGRVSFLKTEEIDWIEAQGKYVMIHAGEEAHLIRDAMNNLETELDPKKFVRIHKSAIVNIDQIKELHPLVHGDFRVILRDSTELTISRRYREKVDELLGKEL